MPAVAWNIPKITGGSSLLWDIQYEPSMIHRSPCMASAGYGRGAGKPAAGEAAIRFLAFPSAVSKLREAATLSFRS